MTGGSPGPTRRTVSRPTPRVRSSPPTYRPATRSTCGLAGRAPTTGPTPSRRTRSSGTPYRSCARSPCDRSEPMGMFSRTYFGDTTPNTGAAYNLISIGSGTTLTRVEVRGGITFPGQSAGASDYFLGGPLLGIQAYPAASSPLHLPTDIDH